MQRVYQSERAVYLMRPYLFASLTHRTSSRPFLTPIEKAGRGLVSSSTGTAPPASTRGWCVGSQGMRRLPPPAPSSFSSSLQRWLAYQLLQALAQCHSRGVCHGDIKPENVLVSDRAGMLVVVSDRAADAPQWGALGWKPSGGALGGSPGGCPAAERACGVGVGGCVV